jgi:uncharacterized ferritin-like protein (DUF455 family)
VNDLGSACRAVLETADPHTKVMAARAVARDWRLGRLRFAFDALMPARPARRDRPILLPPSHMPRRGRAGTQRTRIAMLHALAHIEYVAIDLAFDLVGRFGSMFPERFADQWLVVGAQEALHFALVDRRLRALGTAYGDLPAHDGLWEAAAATVNDALARLAVVPMVLEARGLDATPPMIARFETAGDAASARILKRIAADEVGHVAAGVEWFGYLCAAQRFEPVETWRKLVRQNFGGAVKPPFNDSARDEAGLTKAYYLGLAADCDPSHKGPASQQGGQS